MWNLGVLVALLGVAAFSEQGRSTCRKVAKKGIKAGIVVADKAGQVLGDCKEQAADLVAEVKAERAEKAAK